jgi:hypothetical protein
MIVETMVFAFVTVTYRFIDTGDNKFAASRPIDPPSDTPTVSAKAPVHGHTSNEPMGDTLAPTVQQPPPDVGKPGHGMNVEIPVPEGQRPLWDMGITYCGSNPSDYDEVAEQLQSLNFINLRPREIYRNRKDATYGLARDYQVLYYDPLSKAAALALSEYLSDFLGVKFLPPMIGTGSGVDPGLKTKTLFIHLIDSGCSS